MVMSQDLRPGRVRGRRITRAVSVSNTSWGAGGLRPRRTPVAPRTVAASSHASRTSTIVVVRRRSWRVIAQRTDGPPSTAEVTDDVSFVVRRDAQRLVQGR